MRYDTYCIFYIPVNFAFNLPHYVTSYIHHTGKKESKKEIKKRRRKKKGYEKLLQGDSKQDLQNQLELKRNASKCLYPLHHLGKRRKCWFKRGSYSFSMLIDSFQG